MRQYPWTVAEVRSKLPDIPDDRILVYPVPGTATKEDLLEAESRTGYICELIDGTLVKKTMETYGSMLASAGTASSYVATLRITNSAH